MNKITVNTLGLPKGKMVLRVSQPRKAKGIIEKVKALFGKKFENIEYVESYYRKGSTIFVKPLQKSEVKPNK